MRAVRSRQGTVALAGDFLFKPTSFRRTMMTRIRYVAGSLTLLALLAGRADATNYTLECVSTYSNASGFTTADNLPNACNSTDGFDLWFNLFGSHSRRFYWKDTLVWPSDYREDSLGGSDNIEADWSSADLNVFSGHGSCQNPPTASSPDFIVTARNGIGRNANFVNINASLRLGEFLGSGVFGSNGNLNTLMLDASCPMDLVSLTNQWWTAFQGLHVAMGHSGDVNHDTLDDASRLATVGMYLGPWLPPFNFGGGSSYRTAWMSAGLIGVQSQVCAVITGAGRTQTEAESRRDFETPTNRIPDALPATWLAWRWVCN
jgi:hypothetical protein